MAAPPSGPADVRWTFVRRVRVGGGRPGLPASWTVVPDLCAPLSSKSPTPPAPPPLCTGYSSMGDLKIALRGGGG